MNVSVNPADGSLTVMAEGRVDTTNSAEFQAELEKAVPQTDTVILDCERLVYISSAGLRVLLFIHKAMDKKGGSLVLENVNDDIGEIFEITGFSDILNIR